MSQAEKRAVQVPVPSNDPAKNNSNNKPQPRNGKDAADEKMSDEDVRIKEQVDLLVTRAGDGNVGVARIAVEQLADLLRSSGSGSVASVPKPLKYVRALYPQLEQTLAASSDAALTRRLHDVLSFIAMTLVRDDGNRRAALEHKLRGTTDDLAQWGHEYLRFLAGNIAEEWKERSSGKTSSGSSSSGSTAELDGLVTQIAQYMLSHQDEPTALDLLIEVDDVARVLRFVDESNYRRIASYLTATARYLTRPTDREVLVTVYEMFAKMDAYHDAVVTALQLNDRARVRALFARCTSTAARLQMALTCARVRVFFDWDDEEQDELLQEANGNMRLSQMYRHVAQSLDAMAPKAPEEVFKAAGSESNASRAAKDTRYNLACAFVSGLANCGYGKDKYLTESDTFVFDQREDRILTTTATLGLLHLWDYAEGLQAIDRYFYSESSYIKAGACLASGLVMCGVKNPFDPALGLLAENVTAPQREVAMGAMLGLGYAYAGTCKEEVKELLVPVLADSGQALEVQCMAAYALALVYVGSADEDICETMMNCLLEVPEKRLTEACVRYLILALGCMFLRCQEAADTLLDATQALSPVIRRYTEIVIRSCAFAATGNVVLIQEMFHVIAENDDGGAAATDADDSSGSGSGAAAAAAAASDADTPIIAPAPNATPPSSSTATTPAGSTTTAPPQTQSAQAQPSSPPAPTTNTTATTAAHEPPPQQQQQQQLNYKAAAVLGIGLVAMGEELGEEMAKRAIIHALLADTVSKGSPAMSGRRAVPLVYALLSASNPNMAVVETLNRLAHDSDVATATNAILSMGVVAAGSNNARVAGKLKSLASYYHRDRYAPILFMVRLAQGLCVMGKGHLTLSPLYNDHALISSTGIMGLLCFLHSALDMEKTILDKYDYMLFAIAPNIRPRMVVAVDERMEPVKDVQVRVGLPVDTVALPGKPKSITGFQTQTTPVLLSATDKVEVADAKYKPLPSFIEGIFVVEPKPPVS